MRSMTLYHGAHTRFALHVGLCLTDDRSSAETYRQGKGELAEVELDLTGLCVLDLDEGYNRDEDEAPADRDPSEFDCDVIVYDDEDLRGRPHRTWRLVSDRAVDAVTSAVLLLP